MSNDPAVQHFISPRLQGTWDEFRADAAAAVQVWRSVIWLPLIAIVLVPGGSYLPIQASEFAIDPTTDGGTLGGLLVAALAVGFVLMVAMTLFSIGWSGSERLTYARVWSGRSASFGETWSATWGYLGRYFVLGLLLFLPFAIVSLMLNSIAGEAGGALAYFPLSVLLTFVTPALAFDEDRAMEGLRVGWRMLRRQGRGAVWYAVFGPAAVTAVSLLVFPAPWVGWLPGAVMLAVLRGATASAYLRITRPAGVMSPPPAGP